MLKSRKRKFLIIGIIIVIFIMMTPNYKQAEGDKIKLGDVNGDKLNNNYARKCRR